MAWIIAILVLLTSPEPTPTLHAIWVDGHVVVSWQSDVPVCLAVWKPGTGEHLLPETCATNTWQLTTGGADYAYTVNQDTKLHLIANDGNPRILASYQVDLQPRQWLSIIQK